MKGAGGTGARRAAVLLMGVLATTIFIGINFLHQSGFALTTLMAILASVAVMSVIAFLLWREERHR